MSDEWKAYRASSCWPAQRFMARHLRREHGWGIRRIGRELGLPDRAVKEACADLPGEADDE